MARTSVVLDTNIVVSALLTSTGLERFVLDLAIAGKIRLSISLQILEEYRSVLSRQKFKLSPAVVDDFLAIIQSSARIVLPVAGVRGASDPDDNKFLACAEAAAADFLVTGNARHFPARWGDTQIVNTRKFVSLLPALLQP